MDARQIRRAAAAAADQCRLPAPEPVDLDYDRTAGLWAWTYTDGPAPDTVAAALGPATGHVRLQRRFSPRATALGAVLAAQHRPRETGAAHPDRAPDARTGALADALAARMPDHAADDDRAVAEHLRRIGLAALLHPYTGGTGPDAEDPLAMTPLEHLTDRYAARVDAEAAAAWRGSLTVLGERQAALCALAEEDADRATRLAAVALLGALRAGLEAMEDRALTAATEAGASYAELGRAMGVARQVAHRRHARRAGRHPSRSSPQR
ncbi:hypothetical protein HNR25_005165 [Streptomonospora salina]|uniref:Uncharacterized protein n=1 Tax=Streptomonospora salina TaxID=104205 RepID=A0A841EGB0_9ACTN|nr:hypothetical protein [Streptomonospora salina]MBB6001334.1 hypothetical protein [Streptomonospora salina]